MKNKKIFILMALLCTKAFASVTTDENEIPQLKPTPKKSILNTRSNAAFLHSAFHTANYFYLGTNATGKTNYSLARAYLYNDTSVENNPIKVGIDPLAPKTTLVNAKNAKDEKKNNPIYNTDIKDLKIIGGVPLVLLGTRNPLYTDAPTGADQTIALVTDADAGSSIIVNTKKIKDAAEADTNGVIGIEAGRNYVFAAVSPNGSTFGNANSGIAVLSSGLEPVDATTGKEGNKAQDVITPAGTNITVKNHVAMHWDQKLQRLFVGLEIATGIGPSTAFGLLVGRLAGIREPKLTLEPALPSTSINSDSDYILSYNGAFDRDIKLHHIKTMHTSTGKVYVIVCGNVYSGGILKKEVFAIPIVHQQYSNKPLANNDDIGKVTAKNNADQDVIIPAYDTTKVTRQTDQAAIVGNFTTPGDVQKMFVKGDAVYVCLIDNTSKATKGIFQSSAIFDQNGLIRDWTPWQRVMGAPDRVFGADIDVNTANFWYLTEAVPTAGPTGDTVKVTRWDQTDANLLGNLKDKLAQEFPQKNGGVHQMFNFDEATTCFEINKFSMMVATGLGKAALIRTGLDDGTSFAPTTGTDFTGANLADNLKVYSSAALQNIGPICCAEVSRSAEGWLFVGGYNGLAVLSSEVGGQEGRGFTDLNDLTTDLTGFTFKKLGNFKNVHKIVSDGNFVYILTPKALYRIELDSDKFKQTAPIALDAQIIAQPTYDNIPTCDYNDSFLDFIVSSKVGILATTSGLYRTSNGKDVADLADVNEARDWTQVLTISGSNLGPVAHLNYNSISKNDFSSGGNLNAIHANISTELSTIVRFDVADTSGAAITNDTILPIAEQKEKESDNPRDYYYPFGEFRSASVTEGTFSFHTLPKHFEQTNYLKKINMHHLLTLVRSNDRVLLINLGASAHNIGIPVQNSASGAWMIPGDWGVRINE